MPAPTSTPHPLPEHRNLREAHAHIAQHGHAMSMLRLEMCTSVDDVLERISRAMETRTSPSWLLGVGLRVEGWEVPCWPTAQQLDAVTGPRPACLWSFDHHALLLNTPGMRAVGITSDTADPDNGRIVRGKGCGHSPGEPTGLMLEGAAKMAWHRIPEPSGDDRRAQVRAALGDLAGHGFREVHDLVSQPWLGPLLADMHDRGELPMRVLLYPLLADFKAVLATAPDWQREGVRLAGAKLFADGTLNSRTAWMLHDYADPLPDMPRGQAMLSVQQLCDAMARAWSCGLGLAVHAIGDGAVRAVLDAAEEAGIHRGAPARARSAGVPPLRIEHAEMIDAADVPRFGSLGVVASVQPCHLLTDIEVLQRSLPHRCDRVLPLRELIDTGCRPGELLWFGSDTPIVRPHPEDSIQAAVFRRRLGMAEGLAPSQAISAGEAWAAFATSPLN